MVAAIHEATAEVKYFVTNATEAPVARVLAVAFRRATVEHSFRVAKTEAGLTHYEGRQYVGLSKSAKVFSCRIPEKTGHFHQAV